MVTHAAWLATVQDVLPDKDLLTTPGHPEIKKYDSCAVVGNSGSLLETQYGDMIDNHDVVIRFNAAKTEGCVCERVGELCAWRCLGL